MTDSENTIYYLDTAEPLGPCDATSIYSLLAKNVISLDTLVWAEGQAEWLPIKETALKSFGAKNRYSIRKDDEEEILLAQSPSSKNSDDDIMPSFSSRNRTPSQLLVSYKEVGNGSKVWVEDLENVWTEAEIIRDNSLLLDVRKVLSGDILTIDLNFGEIHKINQKVVPDMTSLNNIHEPGILHNLAERATSRNPYTFMGSVLIAVNPLQRLATPEKTEFVDKPLQPDNPHPYAIAELCYHHLRFNSAINQSICISGESGSGKTETAKIVLNYLASRSCDKSTSTSTGGLDVRILRSSPILEGFGNAKTLRNNNSSRFGKFMKLFFESDSPKKLKLTSAAVETYLLEKSRVVSQTEGERNYHIFYQLLSAQHSTSTLEALQLQNRTADDFQILNQSGCISFPGAQDASDFQAVSEALQTIGCSPLYIQQMWRVLAGILHIGNIIFLAEDTPEGVVSVIGNKPQFQSAAAVLGIEEEELRKLFTERVMITRGEAITIKLIPKDAAYARDAVVKAIYENLFSIVVQQVNASLKQPEDTKTSPGKSSLTATAAKQFVGVLDIFGFESFTRNEFEQLLINYANEALQDTFNGQVFEAELRLFEEENIQCEVSSCPDNSGCVELVAGRTSILSSLDGVCRQPKPSDERFCEDLHKTFGQDLFFPQTHPKDRRSTFFVKHYAGKVQYTVGSKERNADSCVWVDKNNDQSPDMLGAVIATSSVELLQSLLSKPKHKPKETATRRQSAFNKPTIASIFTKSMQDLNALLQGTRCSFIRCIKPNAAMKVNIFDRQYVVQQIRALGLLQTCEVLKVGLPTRIPYIELRTALSVIADIAEELFIDEPEEVLIAALLLACDIPPEVYRLGRTRVFFKAGMLDMVEGLMSSFSNGDKIDSAKLDGWRVGLKEALDNRLKAKEIESKIKENISVGEQNFKDAQQSLTVTQERAQNSAKKATPFAVRKAYLSAESETAALKVLIQTVDSELTDLKEEVRGNPEDIVALVSSKLEGCEEKILFAKSMLLDAEKYYAAMKEAERESRVRSARDMATDLWGSVERMESLLKEAKLRGRETYDWSVRCRLADTQNSAMLCCELLDEIESMSKRLRVGVTDMEESAERATEMMVSARRSAESCIDSCDSAKLVLDQIKVESILILTEVRDALVRKEQEEIEAEKKRIQLEEEEKERLRLLQAAEKERQLTQQQDTDAEMPPISAFYEQEGTDDGSDAAHHTPPPSESKRSSLGRIASLSRSIADRIMKSPLASRDDYDNSSMLLSDTIRESIEPTTTATPNMNRLSGRHWSPLPKEPPAYSGEDPPSPENEVEYQGGSGYSIGKVSGHWELCKDPSTNRTYYYNNVTEMSQWEIPADVELSPQDDVEEEARDHFPGDSPLPPGPGIGTLSDANANLHTPPPPPSKYNYWDAVSLLRRPESGAGAGSAEKLNRVSYRNINSPNGNGLNNNNSNSPSRYSIAALPLPESFRIRSGLTASPSSSEKSKTKEHRSTMSFSISFGTRITKTDFENSALITKEGYLSKQSKILGRWKRKYVILDGNTIEYFDKKQNAISGKGKKLTLTKKSVTAFTNAHLCFCVSTPNLDGSKIEWFLTARDDKDLREWVSTINAHIYSEYLKNSNPMMGSDIWEQGEIGISFWQPIEIPSQPIRAVGIRTFPDYLGPRTGEGIGPGEVIEVVQTLSKDNNNFLKIADDRGWVFEFHPETQQQLMARQDGFFMQDECQLKYICTTGPLGIRFGPSVTSPLTEFCLHHGDVVKTYCSWQPVTEPDQKYFKLMDGRGWIFIKNPLTHQYLLDNILENSLAVE